MDATSLEQRVRDLERRCRRLQIGAVVLGAALGGACLTAALAPAPAVVRAERFELVNGAGQTRGRLEISGVTPQLVLESPENGSLAGLSAGPSVRRMHEGDVKFKHLGPNSIDIGWAAEGEQSSLGTATLSLAGISRGSPWTELQTRPDGSTLNMDSAGPTLVMSAAIPEGPEAGVFLHMTADDSTENGPYGHATFGATQHGGYPTPGADDIDLVQVEGVGGAPSIELRNAREKSIFHAP